MKITFITRFLCLIGLLLLGYSYYSPIDVESNTPKSSICEIPADFINNAVNLIPKLSLDSSDPKLNSIAVDENILADFGSNISDNVVFDAFIFFQADDSKTNSFRLNTSAAWGRNRLSPKIYVYTCGCEDENCDPKFIGKSNASNTFSLNFAPPGFYYVIIAGEKEKSYSLKIAPKGVCGADVKSYKLGSTVQGNLSFSNNTFDRKRSENNIFDCYDGNLNYTGGDIVYQFRVEETQMTTFSLSSPSVSGMFLYDFLCGGECIASAETGTNNKASMEDIYLSPGVYHLIIDQAAKIFFGGQYILSSISETSELPDYALSGGSILVCRPPVGFQKIILSEELKNTVLGNDNISEKFEFSFYTTNNPISNFSLRGDTYPAFKAYEAGLNIDIPIVERKSTYACHFALNDQLKMKAYNRRAGEVYDLDITAKASDGSVSDGTIAVDKTITITSLKEQGRGKFVVTNPTITIPQSGGTRYFYIQADPHTSWKIREDKNIGNTIVVATTYINQIFTGTEVIKVKANANTSNQLHRLELDIVSDDDFHQSVTIYQRGRNKLKQSSSNE